MAGLDNEVTTQVIASTLKELENSSRANDPASFLKKIPSLLEINAPQETLDQARKLGETAPIWKQAILDMTTQDEEGDADAVRLSLKVATVLGMDQRDDIPLAKQRVEYLKKKYSTPIAPVPIAEPITMPAPIIDTVVTSTPVHTAEPTVAPAEIVPTPTELSPVRRKELLKEIAVYKKATASLPDVRLLVTMYEVTANQAQTLLDETEGKKPTHKPATPVAPPPIPAAPTATPVVPAAESTPVVPSAPEPVAAAQPAAAEPTEPVSETLPFDFLTKEDPSKVADFLKNEPPQNIAIVLNHLNPELTANLISRLEPSLRAEVARRMATMERDGPDVLNELQYLIKTRFAVKDVPTVTAAAPARLSEGTPLNEEVQNLVSEIEDVMFNPDRHFEPENKIADLRQQLAKVLPNEKQRPSILLISTEKAQTPRDLLGDLLHQFIDKPNITDSDFAAFDDLFAQSSVRIATSYKRFREILLNSRPRENISDIDPRRSIEAELLGVWKEEMKTDALYNGYDQMDSAQSGGAFRALLREGVPITLEKLTEAFDRWTKDSAEYQRRVRNYRETNNSRLKELAEKTPGLEVVAADGGVFLRKIVVPPTPEAPVPVAEPAATEPIEDNAVSERGLTEDRKREVIRLAEEATFLLNTIDVDPSKGNLQEQLPYLLYGKDAVRLQATPGQLLEYLEGTPFPRKIYPIKKGPLKFDVIVDPSLTDTHYDWVGEGEILAISGEAGAHVKAGKFPTVYHGEKFSVDLRNNDEETGLIAENAIYNVPKVPYLEDQTAALRKQIDEMVTDLNTVISENLNTEASTESFVKITGQPFEVAGYRLRDGKLQVDFRKKVA